MNKIGKAMLCTVLTGAMAVGAAGAADLGTLTPQGAKAYLDQIVTLQNQYGKAAARTDDGFSGLLTGLSMAKLVDMDGDGTPELYCGAGLDGQHMYSYADGKIYALDIPEGVSNFGTDVSPCADFYVGGTKAYLVDGHEIMNGFPVKYLTKQGRKIVTALTYTDAIDDDTGNHICTLNGESVTYHELSAAQVAFTKGMTWEHYSFWESPYNVPEVRSARASLTDTITSLRTLTNPTAYVSKHKVELNGAKANLAAYTINGSNYFKLRDLAAALKGLDSEFAVTWNAAQQRIDLTSKTAYTPVGGEQAALPAGNKAASLTSAAFPHRLLHRRQQLLQAARPRFRARLFRGLERGHHDYDLDRKIKNTLHTAKSHRFKETVAFSCAKRNLTGLLRCSLRCHRWCSS